MDKIDNEFKKLIEIEVNNYLKEETSFKEYMQSMKSLNQWLKEIQK